MDGTKGINGGYSGDEGIAVKQHPPFAQLLHTQANGGDKAERIRNLRNQASHQPVPDWQPHPRLPC